MCRIEKGDGIWVGVENCAGFLKTDAMFNIVSFCFVGIPFKVHARSYLQILCFVALDFIFPNFVAVDIISVIMNDGGTILVLSSCSRSNGIVN